MKLLDKDLQGIVLRDEQKFTLEHIKNVFDTQKNNKYFLLDLPTGVGKSILSMSIIKWYMSNIDSGTNFDILTNSKILQKQYTDEFRSVSNIWGRNEYKCSEFDCDCEHGAEFAKITKKKCPNCPYEADRNSYLTSKINLTNFHLYTIFRFSGFLDKRKSDVLIVDEAHELENIVSDFITVNINNSRFTKMRLPNASSLLRDLRKIDDIYTARDFIDKQLLGEIRSNVDTLKANRLTNKKSINRDLKINKALDEVSEEVDSNKAIEECEGYISKLEKFLEDFEKYPDNWVMEYTIDNKTKHKSISLTPIWVGEYIHKYIWSNYKYVFLLSGTILDRDIFSDINGIEREYANYLRVDSPFQLNKRPIYYLPVGKMSRNLKEDSFQKMIPIMNKLLSKYKHHKGIIHTNTFEIADMVKEFIPDKRIIHHSPDSRSKVAALDILYTSSEPKVVCSPSLYTGIDLKDDRSRFQIMLKVPYPYLGSLKNKQRMKTNSQWYGYYTVQKFIQTYGRAVRNYNDWAEFIILDANFTNLLSYNSKYFPNWVLSAIKQHNV